ncbi:hypothetical protein ABBQ32_013930 [Trebouxia sp. C0010 RCD-2024]
MSLLATSIQRPSLAFQASRPVSRPATRSVRVVAKGTGPGLGNSDPQKVKEQKDEKKKGVWGEPENKNPLEKQTVNRLSPTGQSKGMKDEGAINKEQVKQGTQDAPDSGKNVIEKAGDAVAGAVDKIRPDKE